MARIKMREPARSEHGLSIWPKYQSFNASDVYADELVQAGRASAVEAVKMSAMSDCMFSSSKITTQQGRMKVGGRDYRGVFINAVDLFHDFLRPFAITAISKANPGTLTVTQTLAVNDPVLVSGVGGMVELDGYYLVNTASGTQITLKTLAGVPVSTAGFTNYTTGGQVQRAWYKLDLPRLAGYGVKLVRCSLGVTSETQAAVWTSTIGTDGAAPSANLLSSLKTFLDQCWANGIGVELALFWDYKTVPTVKGADVTAYQTPGSASRVYMIALAGYLARNLYKHPGLAAWNIGNEWYDVASIARFATVTTNTGVDHLKILSDICTDIVAAIRAWDSDRSVFAPHGTDGFYQGGMPQEFLAKFIRSAGACDVVPFHLYPDTNRVGFNHAFVGPDLGGADIFLPMLRSACLQAGKVLVIEECGAEDDAPLYSGKPVGAMSRRSYDKCFAAGVELVGDWSWYVTVGGGGGGVSDLKSQRLLVMDRIGAYNAVLAPGFLEPPAAYPQETPRKRRKWARGSGLVGSHVQIPNSADFSLAVDATASLTVMFYARYMAPLGTNAQLAACDNGTTGWRINLNANGGIKFYLLLNGVYVAFDLGSFTYPANMEPDPTIVRPGDPFHFTMHWDGAIDGAAGSDNSQHATLYINGLVAGRLAYTGQAATGLTDRSLFLLSNSDGSGANAQMDIGDLMFAKGLKLTSQMVADYVRLGVVPTGIQHRYEFNGNCQDSIGTLHGVAGPGLMFVGS